MAIKGTLSPRRLGRGVVLIALALIGLLLYLKSDRRALAGRTYEVVVTGPPSKSPMPLVFVFHGRNGTSTEIRYRTGIAEAAEARGERALFVFPQAREYPGYHAVGWQTACDGPDMRFIDAVVHALSAEYPIDHTRIFASGFSWGGEMAIAFGCCRHEQVRAIAPMSGGVWDSVGEACRTHAPAFRITIGLDDAIELPSIVQHLTDEFRSLHRCSKQSHVTDPHCNAYEGCDAPVIQCLYPGLAHQVPSEAGPEIWQFFRSFPGRTGS